MIDKREIIDTATALGLTPHVVEKDYVLGQKCAFKGMDVPVFAGLEPQRALLEGNWDQMLAHQLPVLPPFAAFWDELPVFFDWLRGGSRLRSLPPMSERRVSGHSASARCAFL